MESSDKNGYWVGKDTDQERELDERETQLREQITKKQEIWACDMESADKNEKEKETGQERELDERETQERERADNKKTRDMGI